MCREVCVLVKLFVGLSTKDESQTDAGVFITKSKGEDGSNINDEIFNDKGELLYLQ